MRKDVRMGFAVGGVLFAVIIVAVLIVHHNKNRAKAVGIDLSGKAAPVNNTGEVDVGSGPTAPAADKQNEVPQPQADQPKPSNDGNRVAAKDDSARDSADDKAKADPWGQLFDSTAADPVKELASSRQKASRHKADDGATDEKTRVTGVGGDAEVHPLIQPEVDRHNVETDPPEPRAAAPRSTPRTHRIAQGETFASISRMVYGSVRYANAIARANPGVNPARLRPGAVIQLPSQADVQQPAAGKQQARADQKPAAKPTAGPSGPALAADRSTYTVQNGDNLYRISRKLYGNGSKGDELYSANKDRIGPDQARLKVGMVLTLPEKPTVAGR